MSLSKEAIEEFKKNYEKEFGEQISDSEACEKFLRLVDLLRAILKGAENAASGHKDQDNKDTGLSFVDEPYRNDKLKE